MRRFAIFCILLLVLAAAISPAWTWGKLTSVGEGRDKVTVMIVGGTPWEMGYAYGKYLKADIKACLDRYLGSAQTAGGERYSDASLDQAWETVKPYIKPRFMQEMVGLAEGAGLPLDQVRRAHAISLVSDYSCSGVAVWGPAAANGHLYQIRNLDFSTSVGLQDHPVIVVYVPKEGIPHANVTFAGYIGSMAGMNAAGIALTEKGATPGRDWPYHLEGVPFFTMFRDILQEADSLDKAVSMVQNVKRHKKYYYVIGDGDAKRAVKMNAFAPDLLIQRDNDPNDEFAPRVKPNLVYVTMKNDLAWKHFNDNYGKYDAQKMIELSRLVQGGGNLMNVVYDATSRELWVAYADGAEMAWQRPYVHFALNDYLPKK